ncbi:tyrosine-type recombinase/integrase [Streptomyces sp. SAI-127]|uniref:tyrosine-type recombinase/integrase n=1 Tax=Streptomyces sp. SAI-127 TaxID=2940543 RepID=UPI002476608E|nr:tyrosine-type recombinase/integrase [Streptomyces sp. SAI-127]MDH6488433.1 integrase [Streptomyces sp. SAI-127]
MGGTRRRLLLARRQAARRSQHRRAFRQALRDIDGVNADEWTPRELRHGFVSLLSDRGVPLEEISRLVGHSGTAVTEEVYRKQIRPEIDTHNE